MKFNIPNLTVRYQAGRLLIGRPAPPEKPKAPTLPELLLERSKLAEILADERVDSAVYPVGLKEKIAALDLKINILAGAK